MWALRLSIPFESCLRANSARKPSTSVLIELCRDGCGVDISYISHLHFTSLLESLFGVCGLSTCLSHQGAKLCLKLCHRAIATSSHFSCLYVCSYDDCFLLTVKGTFQDAVTHLWIWSIILRSDFHVHLGEATYLDLTCVTLLQLLFLLQELCGRHSKSLSLQTYPVSLPAPLTSLILRGQKACL